MWNFGAWILQLPVPPGGWAVPPMQRLYHVHSFKALLLLKWAVNALNFQAKKKNRVLVFQQKRHQQEAWNLDESGIYCSANPGEPNNKPSPKSSHMGGINYPQSW